MINILPRYRIKIWQIILYGIVVVVGDYFGNAITFNIISRLLTPIAESVGRTWYILTLALFTWILVPFVVPWAAVFIFMRFAGIADHYRSRTQKLEWLKSLAILALPVEIVRFLIACGSFGLNSYFCLVPRFLFGEIYMPLTGNYTAYFMGTYELQFHDYIANIVCCLIYMAIHLGVVALMYRYFWRVGERKKKDLVVHETSLL